MTMHYVYGWHWKGSEQLFVHMTAPQFRKEEKRPETEISNDSYA
jgi:hypothetical protein